MEAPSFMSSHDLSMFWCGFYLLSFHLTSDWSQTINIPKMNNFWCSQFYRKDCNSNAINLPLIANCHGAHSVSKSPEIVSNVVFDPQVIIKVPKWKK